MLYIVVKFYDLQMIDHIAPNRGYSLSAAQKYSLIMLVPSSTRTTTCPATHTNFSIKVELTWR